MLWVWKNFLVLMFQWLNWPITWLQCYYFKFLGLKLQPSSQKLRSSCSELEFIQSQHQSSSGVYGTLLCAYFFVTFAEFFITDFTVAYSNGPFVCLTKVAENWVLIRYFVPLCSTLSSYVSFLRSINDFFVNKVFQYIKRCEFMW